MRSAVMLYLADSVAISGVQWCYIWHTVSLYLAYSVAISGTQCRYIWHTVVRTV